jgi:antitoxin (DNA-binding transcriptional repressor) of toxin-antitoxin stability system
MIRLNIHEAKTNLSKYLPALEAGETLILCKRNVPIAEIRPLPKSSRQPRPLGADQGKVVIHKSFFDPLPEEILKDFGA